MERGDYRPHPEVWDGMPVSADAFGRLPRPAGWRYELWDGRLRLEPDWRYHVARWVGPLPDVSDLEDVTVEVAARSDLEALVAAADLAFADGPDYFRAPASRRAAALHATIEDALEVEPEWVRALSRVARAEDGRAVALLLVRQVEGGVALETIGVRPRWRRRGMGAAMLRSVLEARDGVEVRSGWLVANRESGAWHRRVGFEVAPTSVSMQSEPTAERWANGETMEALLRVRDRVDAQRALEVAGETPDPFTFVRPVHRRAAEVR